MRNLTDSERLNEELCEIYLADAEMETFAKNIVDSLVGSSAEEVVASTRAIMKNLTPEQKKKLLETLKRDQEAELAAAKAGAEVS
jgi:hypothetical protein